MTPAILDKNLMIKLKEAFHDFDIFTYVVYRYMKSLRKEYGLISSKKTHKKSPNPKKHKLILIKIILLTFMESIEESNSL